MRSINIALLIIILHIYVDIKCAQYNPFDKKRKVINPDCEISLFPICWCHYVQKGRRFDI